MSEIKDTEVQMENAENFQYFNNIPQQFEKNKSENVTRH